MRAFWFRRAAARLPYHDEFTGPDSTTVPGWQPLNTEGAQDYLDRYSNSMRVAAYHGMGGYCSYVQTQNVPRPRLRASVMTYVGEASGHRAYLGVMCGGPTNWRDGYFAGWFNATEARLYRAVAGAWTQVGSWSGAHAHDVWRTCQLELTAAGDVQWYADDMVTPKITWHDAAPLGGAWIKTFCDASCARFDDMWLWGL